MVKGRIGGYSQLFEIIWAFLIMVFWLTVEVSTWYIIHTSLYYFYLWQFALAAFFQYWKCRLAFSNFHWPFASCKESLSPALQVQHKWLFLSFLSLFVFIFYCLHQFVCISIHYVVFSQKLLFVFILGGWPIFKLWELVVQPHYILIIKYVKPL